MILLPTVWPRGMPFQPELIGILENLANHIYTDDYYQLHPTPQIKNYISGYSKSHQLQFISEIRGYDSATGPAIVDVTI